MEEVQEYLSVEDLQIVLGKEKKKKTRQKSSELNSSTIFKNLKTFWGKTSQICLQI